MIRIWCIALGYLFGMIQTSFLYGKMNGVDIRKEGSGNAGSTNALRVLGKKAGFITLAGDVLKCIAAVLLANLLWKDKYPEMTKLLDLYVGMGVILGHNFPFYLKFKGGKGIAATGGMIISFNGWMTLLGIITFFTGFLTTRYVSLGSLAVYTGFIIELVVFGQMGMFHLSQAYLYELYGIGAFLTILAFYMHRANIKRLLNGTENKTILFKKK